MPIEFVAPQTTGETLAFCVALATLLVGLIFMTIPHRFGRFLGIYDMSASGISELRSAFGGSWVGFALAAILFAQPLIYLALGTAFVFMVIGRVISFLADRSFNGQTVAALLIEAAAGFGLLAYPLQIIP
ncbi:MAG: DUF4345 family protein [Ahrensia sp.]|nr:DUF4345 family protein [Ahrensia sp.]